MKTIRILFFGHLAALAFGLGGLLIALPHPELWDTNSYAIAVFNFGITYAGSLHILFGAATMLLFGLLYVGPRKTLIFFVAATIISLSMELLGTSTGFPFGPYSYTSFLGFKIANHVPYSIPLSWFYMGFTSLILASFLVNSVARRHHTAWSLLLGAYFLTVWLPFCIYTANIGFAIALDINAALWIPPLIAILLGIAPATLVFRPQQRPPARLTTNSPHSVFKHISQQVVRKGSWLLARRDINLTVEGMEHLPQVGPVLIVARHFHHFYDGCALLKTVPRPLHILVALDWVQQPWLRHIMELACTWAQWPMLLRVEQFHTSPDTNTRKRQHAYSHNDAQKSLRRAIQDSVQLLRNKEVLVVFPEAYPTIDPVSTPKTSLDDFLPFRQGFARIVEMAERDKETHVAIIPVGFTYDHSSKWHIALRFGHPLSRTDYSTTTQLVQAVEQEVHTLSRTAITSTATHTEEAIQL